MDGNIAAPVWSVTRGEAKTFTGTHVTSASNTTPINITGWTIQFTARLANKTVLFSVACSIVVAGSGTYSFSLTAANTTVTPGNYEGDIWRTDSGSETIMAHGILVINADTRV
jgi:hypothetical protein